MRVVSRIKSAQRVEIDKRASPYIRRFFHRLDVFVKENSAAIGVQLVILNIVAAELRIGAMNGRHEINRLCGIKRAKVSQNKIDTAAKSRGVENKIAVFSRSVTRLLAVIADDHFFFDRLGIKRPDGTRFVIIVCTGKNRDRVDLVAELAMHPIRLSRKVAENRAVCAVAVRSTAEKPLQLIPIAFSFFTADPFGDRIAQKADRFALPCILHFFFPPIDKFGFKPSLL